jgi:hypothetical protein
MKTQATNGLNQTPEKKLDVPNNMHSTNESIENEVCKSSKSKHYRNISFNLRRFKSGGKQ